MGTPRGPISQPLGVGVPLGCAPRAARPCPVSWPGRPRPRRCPAPLSSSCAGPRRRSLSSCAAQVRPALGVHSVPASHDPHCRVGRVRARGRRLGARGSAGGRPGCLWGGLGLRGRPVFRGPCSPASDGAADFGFISSERKRRGDSSCQREAEVLAAAAARPGACAPADRAAAQAGEAQAGAGEAPRPSEQPWGSRGRPCRVWDGVGPGRRGARPARGGCSGAPRVTGLVKGAGRWWAAAETECARAFEAGTSRGRGRQEGHVAGITASAVFRR